MDAAVDAVILIDHTGRIEAFNRSAERLFGWTAVELHGQNVKVLMPQPDRDSHDAYLSRYAETGIAHIIGVGRDLQAQRKDGSCFDAHLSVGRIAGAEPARFVGFVRDITTERQAMAAIQAERDLAGAYLELGHTILLTLDSEYRIRVINARGCELLGASESELLGRNWFETAFPSAQRADALAHLEKALLLAPQQVHNCELTVHAANGQPRLLAWRCLSLRNPAGAVTGILCSAEDVTERRRAEEEARRSTDRLVHVARLATMGEMAAGIAHEINQPLTAITNYARACERFLQLPEPDLIETRDAMREIGIEALRAGDIIRRLRRLVRGDDDARVACQLNEVIEELRTLTLADARANDTTIVFELAQNLPPVTIDRIQITQVLLNLIRNGLEALNARPAGQREITVSTRQVPHGEVEVSVCDNGPGVEPRILDRMFDPFCTTKPNGAGLGLPMSRTIVQSHGGRVSYVPAQPHGACFQITLPTGD